MPQTLDQQRARFAWERVNQARRELREYDSYKNLVKGSPALIMGNGLMPALGFYQSRTGSNREAAASLARDIIAWLHERSKMRPNAFGPLMDHLFNAGSLDYMRATDETLSMLKWLRQFADAVN